MEEQNEIVYDTIRVYNATTNTYYDKQVPHVDPIIPEATFEEKQIIINNEQDEINIDLDYRITMLELGL